MFNFQADWQEAYYERLPDGKYPSIVMSLDVKTNEGKPHILIKAMVSDGEHADAPVNVRYYYETKPGLNNLKGLINKTLANLNKNMVIDQNSHKQAGSDFMQIIHFLQAHLNGGAITVGVSTQEKKEENKTYINTYVVSVDQAVPA